MHWSETTPLLLLKALPQWPYLQGSDHVFSSRSPPRFLNKNAANQLQTALTRRPKNRAWACLHQLPNRKTRITAVHKVTLLAMRIEPTRSTTSLWCTRSLSLQCALNLQRLLSLSGWITSLQDLATSISRVHQVYRVFQDHQKAAAYLTAW